MKLAEYLKREGLTHGEFAARLNPRRHASLISQWLSGHRPIAAERVLEIEAATNGKVSRHELRPDIYPRDNAA